MLPVLHPQRPTLHPAQSTEEYVLPGVQGTKAVVLTITKEILIPEAFDYFSNAFCVAGDIGILKQELDF